jgi:hypothetical protein
VQIGSCRELRNKRALQGTAAKPLKLPLPPLLAAGQQACASKAWMSADCSPGLGAAVETRSFNISPDDL